MPPKRGMFCVLLVLLLGAITPATGWTDEDDESEGTGEAAAAGDADAAAKHGKRSTSGYDQNFYFLSADERFRLDIYGYGQVRYVYTDEDGGEDVSDFRVQRARLGFKGHLFSEKLSYKVYLNLYSGGFDQRSDLFDLYFDYVPKSEVGIKMGQYKVPYGESWNTSASNLQLVERPFVDGVFRWDRDTGVDIHGKLADGKVLYDFGIFNGEGRLKGNDNTGHLWVGRLRFEPLGKYPTAQTDLKRVQDPLIKFAIGYAENQELTGHTRPVLNRRLQELGKSNVTQATAYFGLMWNGFNVFTEYHTRTIDPQDPAMNEEDAEGYYIQGGYLLPGDQWEIAARYEDFDIDNNETDGDSERIGIGLNRFFAGHRHKLQLDLFDIDSRLGEATASSTRLRFQWQMKF